ncbi:MAG: hypothetical protein HQM08_13405 [Candidatus Riflebacteria bacterium]|nr:hypothetical protein [Candidatus Riflebacteria bacterium]
MPLRISFTMLVVAFFLSIGIHLFAMSDPVTLYLDELKNQSAESQNLGLESPFQAPDREKIGTDSRILFIGDSHTVGPYGAALDGFLRSTGGKVRSIGVAGSSPAWWLDKTVTHSGFWSRDENGVVDCPADWHTPRETPLLSDQIRDFQPTHLVISLGANLTGLQESQIKTQCDALLASAKPSGATLIWVGPPKRRDNQNQDIMYGYLRLDVGSSAFFIDSRPFTEYPATGGDGIHYSTPEGTPIARSWAKQVFNLIFRQ